MSVQNHQEDDVGQGMLSNNKSRRVGAKGARFRRGAWKPGIPLLLFYSELFFLSDDSSRDQT